MCSIAALPSGRFPTKESTLPFWRTELHELDDHRSTPGLPESCDILIIGGGYAGIAAAYHLLCDDNIKPEPTPSVVLLEARGACSGATARNGGHLRPAVYSHLPSYIEQYGAEAAGEVADFEFDHVKVVAELIEKEGISCDFTLTKSFDVYTDKASAEAAKAAYLTLKRVGIAKATIDDLTWTDAETAEQVSGVKGCIGCFSFTAAHLWPYKLFMSLLARAVSSGLNLQTHTPAISILPSSTQGHWRVSTPRGPITAHKLVITTNGYTATLLPEYTGKIVPARGICSRITVPSNSAHPPLTNTYGLRLGNSSLDYLIPRPDGSIIVGGARSTFFTTRSEWHDVVDDSTLITPAAHYFDDFMQRNFIGWEESGATVDSIWTGIMGYNSDGLPSIGDVPGREGCFIAAGFEGHGMPVIWLAMKGVAKMAGRGVPYGDAGIPRIYKTTRDRLDSERNDLATPDRS